MIVEGHLGHAGLAKDLVDPGGVKAARIEKLQCCFDEFVATSQLAAEAVQTSDDLLEYARDQQERAEQLLKEIS